MTPVTQILFLSIKPGKIDELLEADRNFLTSATLPKDLVSSASTEAWMASHWSAWTSINPSGPRRSTRRT